MRCPACAGRGAVSSTANALRRLIGSIGEGQVDRETFAMAKAVYLNLSRRRGGKR